MNYLLHIDTSADTGLVAVSAGGVLLASRANEASRNHAAAINNMIQDVVADAGTTLAGLAGVVVCAGPGSYTGLRIGLATAKGICYALDKPLFLHNKLSLLAYAAYSCLGKDFARYVSLLTAREKEYFIAVFNSGFECTVQPRHIMQSQLGEWMENEEKTCIITDAPENVVGDLMIKNLQIDHDVKTDLKSWSIYAFREYKCNNIVNLPSSEPFYLKQVYTHN